MSNPIEHDQEISKLEDGFCHLFFPYRKAFYQLVLDDSQISKIQPTHSLKIYPYKRLRDSVYKRTL